MSLTRRTALTTLGAAAGIGIAGSWLPRAAGAADKPKLDIQILGFTLAIHIPAITALHEGLPALGYPEPKLTRIDSMRVLTQSIVANSAAAGEADVVSALRAAEAGADVKVIGLVYNNTSQVFVVNADKITDFSDFQKPDTVVALNSKGDFINVMLSGALMKRGIDMSKITIVEIGGSGSRMRALLSGRVAAVPVHFDQAQEIVKQGNYKVLIQPWKEFNPWISEGWLVNGAWLAKPENQRVAMDLQKAVIASFRRANKEFDYFANSYRKYATLKGASKATDEQLHPVWKTLVEDIKAWPNDGGFKREYFRELLPVYKAANALQGEPDLGKVIDTRYVDQAVKELG